MVKRTVLLIIAGAFLLSLCACGQNVSEQIDGVGQMTWQEQYDLGVRYLSEGNYEEAIIAFTAAIEIDPKQAPAYVGRGQAYVLSGDTEDNLSAAQADFEAAVELDGSLADAWLGLADVHIRRGDYDQALETLQEALERTGNDPSIVDKLAELESGMFLDSRGNPRRRTTFDKDGNISTIYDYQYNERGWKTGWVITHYKDGEVTKTSSATVEFGEDGYPAKNIYYGEDGTPSGSYDLMTFNELGQEVERHKYYSDGDVAIFRYYYDDSGRKTHYESYAEDGVTLKSTSVYEYDENGREIGITRYNAGGEVTGTSTFSD